MIASLPMYWRAENADAWRRLWAGVQERTSLALPDLTPPEALPPIWDDHWRAPDLILSQTCGLPFRTRLRDGVTYVGTFDFGLSCPPGYYYSEIIGAWPTGPRATPAKRLAYNAADSQSGWAAAQELDHICGPLALDTFIPTGAHEASMREVAEGAADIACIDAVTWRLLERTDPRTTSVHPWGRTDATPGLPLITAKGQDPEPLRQALRGAIACLEPGDAAAMGGLRGLAILDADDYCGVPVPAPPPS